MMIWKRKFGVLALVFLFTFGCGTKSGSSVSSAVPAGGLTGAGGTGATGSSGSSGTVSPSAPSAPSSVTGSSSTSSTATITWANNANGNETGFHLMRSATLTGTYALVATIPKSTPEALTYTYTNSGLTALTTYFYQVSAYSAGGDSAYTTPISVTTLSSGAPSNLTAQSTSSVSISLAWLDNTTTATGYLVERSFTGGTGATWASLATLPQGSTHYIDIGLYPGETYHYRVTAIDTINATSNEAFGTTFSGSWNELNGSASGSGISNAAGKSASQPSVAVDSSGRSMAVWEQDVAGVSQIYAAVYDNPGGWIPLIMNGKITVTTGADGSTTEEIAASTSMTGGGLSLAVGDAQHPRVAYDQNNDEFIVVWQEVKAGHYEIKGRRVSKLQNDGTMYRAALSNGTNSSAVISASVTAYYFTNVASTWNLSNTTTDSMRPELVDYNGSVYTVWEEYRTSTQKWQIYGITSTIAAFGTSNPPVPAMAQFGAAAGSGDSSNALNGISQSATQARLPSIAVGSNALIYVAWQEYVAAQNWNIKATFCTGAACPAPTTVVSNSSSAQNVKIAADPTSSSNMPYLAWEENIYAFPGQIGSNHFNIYLKQGSATDQTSWSTLSASGFSSGDKTTGGLSNDLTGNAQAPSVAVAGTSLYVGWQDTNGGTSNIYVKKYLSTDTVPGEPASWSGMAGSDLSPGISNAAVGAANLTLMATTAGSIFAVWEDLTAASPAVTQIYLRRW